MKQHILYLFSLMIFLVACSEKEQEAKVLYPVKVVAGNTTYEFQYSRGRIYSVTQTKPNFYEEVSYRYFDEASRIPEHRFKDKIVKVTYVPDNGTIGWDKSDYVRYKHEMLSRMSDSLDLVTHMSQHIYLPNGRHEDHIVHSYNKDKQLSKSTHYYYPVIDSTSASPRYIKKWVDYRYDNTGKLTTLSHHVPGSKKPELLINMEYDDHPGYLRHVPLEARFLEVEIPYRKHNILSHTVTDAKGRVNKDLSYTCSYTYNNDGYPAKFTKKLLNGKQESGYFVYKSHIGDTLKVASVSENLEEDNSKK